MMVIGALCHTREADELFDGPVSRSMDLRPAKEDWLFGALGVDAGRPFIEIAPDTIKRVAWKIVAGLAYNIGAGSPSAGEVRIEEVEGRGAHAAWAPDFSFSKLQSYWELWFFDSVRLIVSPAYPSFAADGCECDPEPLG